MSYDDWKTTEPPDEEFTTCKWCKEWIQWGTDFCSLKCEREYVLDEAQSMADWRDR